MIKRTAGSGIFSIAMLDDLRGIIVGGNYEKPNESISNLTFTKNGGKSWRLGNGLTGYRSGVALVGQTVFAVGTNGTDISGDLGKTWKKFGSENLNSVQAILVGYETNVWAVGPNGLVAGFSQTVHPF